MPLMRIIFPKGSSQSPSIQCNVLQQWTGLRILRSPYPHIQSLPGKNHSPFDVFQQDTLGCVEFILFAHE